MTEEKKNLKLELEARLTFYRRELENVLLALSNFRPTCSRMPENPTELDYKRQQRQFKKMSELCAAQDSAFLAYSDILLELAPYDRLPQSEKRLTVLKLDR